MGSGATKTHAVVRKSIRSFMEMINFAVNKNATAIHGIPGNAWKIRINDELKILENTAVPSENDLKFIATYLAKTANKTLPDNPNNFESTFTISFSNEIKFSVHLTHQGNSYAMTMKKISIQSKTLNDFKLINPLQKFLNFHNGLFLICGDTASNRAMIAGSIIENHNRQNHLKIITIEKNIRYCFKDLKSSILQLEIGTDVQNIDSALKEISKNDPDLIYVEQIENVSSLLNLLKISENNCPVILGMPEENTFLATNKLLEILSDHEHEKLSRHRLSQSLKGAIACKFLKKAEDPKKIIFCYELMYLSEKIKNHILKSGPINSFVHILEDGDEQYPEMRSFTQHLKRLFKKGKISKNDLVIHSSRPEDSKNKNPETILNDLTGHSLQISNEEHSETTDDGELNHENSSSDSENSIHINEEEDGIVKNLQLDPGMIQNLNIDYEAPNPWINNNQNKDEISKRKRINEIDKRKRIIKKTG